jgi:hypothetical protein
MKHAELRTLWNELEKAKRDFLQELLNFAPDQLSTKPNETEWSALQVVDHLLLSETGTLGYLKKKTQSGWEGLEFSGEEHKTNGKALIQRLNSTERYKAPAILPEPLGEKSLFAYNEQWDQLRDDFALFLTTLDPNFYERLVFRQPVAGFIDLFDTLRFLTAHIQHHFAQLERIRHELSA